MLAIGMLIFIVLEHEEFAIYIVEWVSHFDRFSHSSRQLLSYYCAYSASPD